MMFAAQHLYSAAPIGSIKGFATKTLLMAAGVAFTIVMLLGFGAYALLGNLQTDTPSTPITLTYWGLWESPELMQPLLDTYHKQNPNITIKYDQRPIENHFASVQSRIASGGTDAPDIVRLHDSWVPSLQKDLSSLPANVMNASLYESTFYGVNRDMLLSGGKYYAMPLEVDGLALVYNQDLFNKANITSPPATWDDLRQDASKLTQRDSSGRLLVGGIAMGTANNVDHFADIVGLLMAQNGVIFSDSKGKASFDNSITPDGRNLGAEALSFYTLFSTTDKDWDSTMEQSTKAFAEGKVGMILIPSWRLLSLVSQNPELPIKVAPVPQLTADQHVGYASYWVEAVPKTSKHQQAAWQFLAWLTQREQQISMVSAQLQTRPFGEPYSRTDLAGSLNSDQYLAAYVSGASGFRASVLAGNTGSNEISDGINEALAKAIGQSASPAGAASALKTVAETVNTLLDK